MAPRCGGLAPALWGRAVTVTIDIGILRQVATLSALGVTSPDGDGGYVPIPSPLSPAEWRCAIDKATARSAERIFSSTVVAIATHVIRGRFHAGITTQTQLTWVDRAGTTHTANVLEVVDTEGAGVETVVAAAEGRP